MAINMNDKSKVINLCNYPVSWKRITQIGDEYIKANAIAYILNSEIETQKDSGNKFIAGVDGLGSHAEIYIDNKELREYLEFDNPTEKRTQFVLDEEKCKSILELKTQKAFEKSVKENVLTNQEKLKLVDVARKNKFNDYEKIKFIEEYCEMTF
jgi:hypothetical protein